MDIQTIFKITYDPNKDGSLSEFRQKKYLPFKAHIERLQLAGTLPRSPVKFSTSKKGSEPRPDGPAPVVPFSMAARPRLLPMLVHTSGTPLMLPPARMDPDRIAI